MNRDGIKTGWVVCAIALVLSGCSILPKNEPMQLDRYTLDARPHTAAVAAVGTGPVLLVARPLARTELDTPRMAYRQQDFDIHYFARSQWADTPPQLMLPGLIEALEASGRFAAVVRAGSPATPELRLDTELLEFSQDFRESPSVFQVRVRAQLVDLTQRRVVASRVFEGQKAAPNASPYGGVQAANAIWQELLPQLVSFCTSQLPSVLPSAARP